MKSIAQFFTIFWVIYFPTCIAFYDTPGFSSIDEVMTGILIIYTLYKKGSRFTNNKPWKEYWIFWGIIVFYIIYSLILQVNVAGSVWYDLMQQIRPYSVLYCTWILNPQFNKSQSKWILYTMIASVIGFFFVHPEVADAEVRMAPLGQLAICTSMTWYLFQKPSKRNIAIAIILAVIGIFSNKFKYYGEFGAWLFLIFFIKRKINFRSEKIVWQLSLLLVIVLMLGWDRFDAYFVSGADNENLARPMMYKAAWKILWDYFPFGSGMGTFGTAASAVYYSPLMYKYELNSVWGLAGTGGFICDSFYASLAQFGFVGLFLFAAFWWRRVKNFYTINDIRYYKVAMMSFFCLLIESTADSSYLSGKGMGFFMLMGLCLNKMGKKKEKREIEHGETTNIRT